MEKMTPTDVTPLDDGAWTPSPGGPQQKGQGSLWRPPDVAPKEGQGTQSLPETSSPRLSVLTTAAVGASEEGGKAKTAAW